MYRLCRNLSVACVVTICLSLTGCATVRPADETVSITAAPPSGCQEITPALPALGEVQSELAVVLAAPDAPIQPARDAYNSFRGATAGLEATEVGDSISALASGLGDLLDLVESARAEVQADDSTGATGQADQSAMDAAEQKVALAAERIFATCVPDN